MVVIMSGQRRLPPHLTAIYLALMLTATLIQHEVTGLLQMTSSSSVSMSSSSIVRLRSNKPRRPIDQCRENLPRRSEDLPALVITGRIKEVFFSNAPSASSNESSSAEFNRALVTINRVIKGNQQLSGDILVSGFNQTHSVQCPNHVKPNDTYILLLRPTGERKYLIHNGNLLSLNLNNLDRINAIASDEPYKRRPPIEDILCEAHYCGYGRCQIISENEVTCHCPESCPSLEQPVCGSDNSTYSSECHLIKEGCDRRRALFVVKETSC